MKIYYLIFTSFLLKIGNYLFWSSQIKKNLFLNDSIFYLTKTGLVKAVASCYIGTICSSFGQTSGSVQTGKCSSPADSYCKSYSGTISSITATVYSCAQSCTDGSGVIDGVLVAFTCCQTDNCNYNHDDSSSSVAFSSLAQRIFPTFRFIFVFLIVEIYLVLFGCF